jgi:hypothetical protein
MTLRIITCPYCASQVTGESTVCPSCQEDLAALAHLEYADAIHYNQALALAKEGRTREAKAELAESLASNSAFAPAFALLAKINARELDWDNARVDAKKALSLSPEDEAIARLADEIINDAPPVDLAPSAEVIDVPANPPPLEHSQVQTDDPGTDTGSGYGGAVPVLVVPDNTAPAEIPASPEPIPSRPRTGAVDRRYPNNRRYEPQSRYSTQAGQVAGPSSYLLPPREVVSPSVKPPARVPLEPQVRPHVSGEPVEPLDEPDLPPIPEPIAAPTESAAPAEQSYPRLFKGSLWRTLGMGILITAGLAILIRTISGED